MNVVAIAAAVTGGASALLYLRRKRWIDAVLAAGAGAALAALLNHAAVPETIGTVTLKTDKADEALQTALLGAPAAAKLVVEGDGLRDAQWRDLPAKAVEWKAPQEDALALDFPRAVALGRTFTLAVTRSRPQAGWRLQLLAENGQVLDEAVAGDAVARLAVQWLPPVAENVVLRARLLDAAGKAIQQGPVPVRVVDAVPLQVVGRFGAPSFDAKVLNGLLADSNAVLDWQTVLGKAVSRTEAARAPLTAPNLVVADAAWFEQQPGARTALLAQVAQGASLLVLGGNAREPGAWQALRPALAAQATTTEKEDARHFAIAGSTLAMAPASFVPTAWPVAARDDDGKPWLWQKEWQKGRILWLGVADWHRHAITAPAALGQWWQRVLDHAAEGTPQKVTWQVADPLPVPGLRTAVCAQGVKAAGAVQVSEQALRWSERAGAACVAWWPRQAGWVSVRSGEAATQLYVYGANDWPAWQAGLRREATALYAARYLPVPSSPAVQAGTSMPAWPFALAFAAALLGLWWRERR